MVCRIPKHADLKDVVWHLLARNGLTLHEACWLWGELGVHLFSEGGCAGTQTACSRMTSMIRVLAKFDTELSMNEKKGECNENTGSHAVSPHDGDT